MESQRNQLASFLRHCRGRLTPEDVGLPDSSRRRTPGLRREDVAALAGVSVTWYTWLEQGRDIRVSDQVLERIAETLRMSQDEREYLFALVQHRRAPLTAGEDESLADEVLRMIDAINVPALVMNLRWDVLAWNDLAVSVFRDYSELEPRERNLLWHLLVNEQYQTDPEEYEAIARRVLAKFRVDYSQMPDDPAMNELVAELSEHCAIFDRLWLDSEVSNKSHGINIVRHPSLGGITFEHSSYVPEGSPHLRLVVFVPNDDDSREKLARLARSQAESAGAREPGLEAVDE